jgi:hypothetical protein
MAPRKNLPVRGSENNSAVEDGTMCRMLSPQPGSLRCSVPLRAAATLAAADGANSGDNEVSGSAIAVGTGMASVARIPVPGTKGLFVELRPRGWTPKAGSTSTLFIQDVTGKRHLRLDFGFNKNSGAVDYHWNQKGTFNDFGIGDHAPAGPAGEALYRGAKYLRYGGRVLLVVGLAVDVYSIVVAKNRWRQVARVAAGWAGAWAGCEGVGALGAGGGTVAEPGLGTAVGGIGGCIVGGIGGYAGASWAAGHAYDWVEETFFEPLPEASRSEAEQ